MRILQHLMFIAGILILIHEVLAVLIFGGPLCMLCSVGG